MGSFPEGTLGGVSQCRHNQWKVPSVQKIGQLFALDAGDDLVEEEYALVVDFLLVLLVEGLHLGEDRLEMIDKLFFIGPCEGIEPFE